MEAVLPLKPSGEYDDRDLQRTKILLASLEAFWDRDDDFVLNIISPRDNIDAIRREITSDRISVRMIDENDIIDTISQRPDLRGWYKQQALKLAAHKIIEGQFYLTLDADIICTQPISDDRLIVQGKALTDWESKALHALWWEGSAKIIGDPLTHDTPGLSVTPEILACDIAAKLEAYLKDRFGEAAYLHVLSSFQHWSEYSLYSLAAEKFGLLHQWHHSDEWMKSNKKALRGRGNFWNAAQSTAWNPDDSFSPGAVGSFIICQSSARVDPSEVWTRVEKFLAR